MHLILCANPGYENRAIHRTGSEYREDVLMFSRHILVIIFALGLASPLFAQFTDLNASTQTPTPGLGHDYLQGLSETVDPSSGSLSLRIHVPEPAGRGLTLPFNFAYDSNGVYVPVWLPNGGSPYNYGNPNNAGSTQWISGGPPQMSSGGWSYTLPMSGGPVQIQHPPVMNGQQPCTTFSNWSFFDPAGGRHPLGGIFTLNTAGNPTCNQLSLTEFDFGGDLTYGGSVSANASGPQSMTVGDLDGTEYFFAGGDGIFPPKVEDRNGNVIRIADTRSAGQITQVNEVDTLGRPVLAIVGFGASGNTVSVAGVTQPYVLSWAGASYNFDPGTAVLPQSPGTGCVLGHAIGSQPVIQSITLPDGQVYAFQYDPTYGLLQKITYPTGSTVTYTWGTNSQSASAITPDSMGAQGGCLYRYGKPAIMKRVVSFDGTTNALEQDFSYLPTTWNPSQGYVAQWTNKSTQVLTKDLLRGAAYTYTTTYAYTPTYSGNPQSQPSTANDIDVQFPVEATVTYQDINNLTVESKTKHWYDAQQLQSELDTMGGAVTAETDYAYLGGTTLVQERDDYDFAAGPSAGGVVRKTITTFQQFPPLDSIVDAPCRITISNGSATLAETDYLYDGGTSLCMAPGTQSVAAVAGLPTGTHDEINYPPSHVSPRGNVTQKIQKCLSNCPGDSPAFFSYDETGQMVSSTDSLGNVTNYVFADSYTADGSPSGNTNAYLTKVIRPQTNGIAHTQTFTYGFLDGKVRSATDENSKSTTYCYTTAGCGGTTLDPWLRVTEIDFPDTGKVAASYVDAGPPSMTVTTSVNSSTTKVLQTIFDRMGHQTSTKFTPGSGPVENTQTTYDGFGRVLTTFNPYRSASDPTYGFTSFTYDALGRTTIETLPDGNIRQWCYNNQKTNGQSNCRANLGKDINYEWTDQADESLNDHQQTTDGGGRLASVLEPDPVSGTPGLETDYIHDALDNLISVKQSGVSGETARSRSFAYDSMSKLTSATNPESGTTTYTYDLIGNLVKKVDARGVATGGIWYCYDALSRLTGKAYTQQTCPLSAPDVAYQYDTSSISGNTNTIGRLTGESVIMNGATSTGRQPYKYDAMGRIQAEQQCTPENCGATPYTVSYTYDLVDDITSSTNGVANPGILWTNYYDGASRLAAVTSSWADAQHPSPLFCATTMAAGGCASQSTAVYNASGQLQSAALAINAATSQPALTLTRTYDTRLRSIAETVNGQTGTTGAPATATVTISGSETSISGGGSATQATGTISLSYSGAMVREAIPFYLGNSITLPGGYHAGFIATANSAITVAKALAAVLNSVSSPVKAVVASGGTASAASIKLTSKATGVDQNGAIMLSLVTTKVKAAPASLSGGAGTTYDTGTVTANIDGISVSVGYSQSSTPTTLAGALAVAISGAGAGVTATPGPSGTVMVTASQAGTSGNGIPVTLSSATNQPKFFSSPSFSGTSGTLSGGTGGNLTPGIIYQYTLQTPGGATGYAANSNLMSYSDLQTGTWALSYDHLNRVSSAAVSSGPWNSLTLQWAYDSFGDRKTQTVGGSPSAPVPQSQTLSFTTNNNNRIDNLGPSAYDTAGNVTNDLINQYVYDAEGRVCAVYNPYGGYMQYIYDAEGRRVGKGSITSLSCAQGSNGFLQTGSYVLGLSGEQVSELDGAGTFVRSHVYANGQLLATYTNSTTGFTFADWLGSKRVVANPDGSVAGACTNLPFGDELSCTGNEPLNGHHFTGQIHDQESGNDYFGARYLGNTTGRFMSPDPTGGSLLNPQTLNKYSYGLNNPLINIDPTGLDCIHVNNDTGAFESFDSGDCDNSTPELANSGQYINGTVNQIQLNQQGQVLGYSGTDDSGSSIGGSFMSAGNGAVYGLNPYTGSLSSSEFGQTVTANGNSPKTPDLSSLAISSLIPTGGFSPITDRVGPIPPTRKMTTGEIASLCQMATALSAGGTVPGAVPASPTEDTPDQNMLVPSQNARYPGETRETVTTPMTTRSSVGNNAANGAAMAGTFAECFAAVSAANR